MAASTGYEVIVIDPRSQFATEQRFLGVEMYIAWPEEVLDEKKISEYDCLITLSHDPKIDDAAICLALQRKVSSISCLGSNVTNSQR